MMRNEILFFKLTLMCLVSQSNKPDLFLGEAIKNFRQRNNMDLIYSSKVSRTDYPIYS